MPETEKFSKVNTTIEQSNKTDFTRFCNYVFPLSKDVGVKSTVDVRYKRYDNTSTKKVRN